MIPELHFVSGWGVPASAWDPVVDLLAPRVHMTAYDATPWNGLPPMPKQGAYLGGWSLGAQLAISAAADQPGAWQGLLLVSATACFCRNTDQAWGTPPRHLDRMSRKLESHAAEVLGDFYQLCAEPHQRDAEKGLRWAAEARRGGPGPLLEGLRHLRDTDLRPLAASLALPVVLLHGREDRVVPWEAGAWLEQHLPRAAALFHDDEGHDLPLRHPQTVLEAFDRLEGMSA